MNALNVLYVSYDGMTDPLGQSQVLPYICGLASKGYRFTLLSCEKPARMKIAEKKIRKICEANQIDWVPLVFHTKPKLLSKLYDLRALKRKALAIHREKNIHLVHCRSYVGVEVGLYLKRRFNQKVLFDMRGFWVDERVDGDMWNLKNPIYRYAYSYYKKKENRFIRESDYIVSLTEAGKKEIKKWPGCANAPIDVIPCSADFDLFTLTTSEDRYKAREQLQLPQNELVVSYLGSIGSWYLLPEMMDFFKMIKEKYPQARFLLITSGDQQTIYNESNRKGIDPNDVVVRFANREEVNKLTKAGDITLCFIKQAYSKIASSPTKLGEIFAMGIPVICNDGVGDVGEIVDMIKGGTVISSFNEKSYQYAIDTFPDLIGLEPKAIRERALSYYSLENAVNAYAMIYKTLSK